MPASRYVTFTRESGVRMLTCMAGGLLVGKPADAVPLSMHALLRRVKRTVREGVVNSACRTATA